MFRNKKPLVFFTMLIFQNPFVDFTIKSNFSFFERFPKVLVKNVKRKK